MTGELPNFVPTLAILQAVSTALQALALPDPYVALGATFEDTRIYAHQNLGQALQDLLILNDRVALIVPAEFAHVNKREGRNLTTQRTLDFAVLIADRVIGGTANEAALGGQDNPGMILLAELALGALIGQDFGLPSVCLEATRGHTLLLPANDASGATFARECWAQMFTTPAGEARVDRGRVRSFAAVPSPVLDNAGN